jgi:inner membrane protein YidH
MTESTAPPSRPGASVSDYLAAERTFLAWIRTGLALMGFGFVVARFGLFLEEFRLAAPALGVQSRVNGGHSVIFGTALIATGVVLDLFACWHHVKMVNQLNRGAAEFTKSSKAAIALGIFLAIVGVAMAIYLISV